MPTKATRMNPATTGADHKLAAGIFSLDQAAAMLDCEPIAIKRLIALGKLNDNRNRSGSVVLKNELEAYIGQGSPNIEMPRLDGDWFRWFRGEVGRIEFQSAIRNAADGLSEISDKQLKDAYKADRMSAKYSFDVRPTQKMKDVYRKSVKLEVYDSVEVDASYGVAALVCQMRAAAKRKLMRVSPASSKGLNPPLWRLYESPKQFRDLIAFAEINSAMELNTTFTDSRVIEGRSNPATVVRVVSFQDLSANWVADLRQAISLAF